MHQDRLLAEIDLKKAELDSKRPLHPITARSIREAICLDWIYHSNALEGNTLTLRETQIVLEGMTLGGRKTMREHLEVVNHAAALDVLYDMIERGQPLSATVVRQLHSLILRGIDATNAGRERQVPVSIMGSRHVPPPPSAVRGLLHDLFSWYRSQAPRLHPVERAAVFHHRVSHIHPFADGNGRTGRLAMNFILIAEGYPPAVMKSDPARRLAYLDALGVADETGDVTALTLVVAEALRESLDRVLRCVNG